MQTTLADFEIIKTVCAVITAISTAFIAFYAIRTLKREFSWRRQQLAVNMLAEWNRQTSEYRTIIDRWKHGLLDPKSTDELTLREAVELNDYRPKVSNTESDDREKQRHAIIELLNYCEYVAVAYQNHVADQAMIDASFTGTISQWYRKLRPFTFARSKQLGRNPWQPLSKWCEDALLSSDDQSLPSDAEFQISQNEYGRGVISAKLGSASGE
jgi:hypothetical protein